MAFFNQPGAVEPSQSTGDMQADLTLVLLTSLQAVTVSLVCYLIYNSQQQHKNEVPKVAAATSKGKNVKDDDTTMESDSSIKEVHIQNEKRSVRGVNVYGPYKKVSLLYFKLRSRKQEYL